MGVVPRPDARLVFLKPGAVEPLVGAVFDIPVGPLEREHFFDTQIDPTSEQVDGQVSSLTPRALSPPSTSYANSLGLAGCRVYAFRDF